jgi:hypothetical protein
LGAGTARWQISLLYYELHLGTRSETYLLHTYYLFHTDRKFVISGSRKNMEIARKTRRSSSLFGLWKRSNGYPGILQYFVYNVEVNFFRAWIKSHLRRFVITRSCVVAMCSVLRRRRRGNSRIILLGRADVGYVPGRSPQGLFPRLALVAVKLAVMWEVDLQKTSVILGDAAVGNYIYKLRRWITNLSLWKKITLSLTHSLTHGAEFF